MKLFFLKFIFVILFIINNLFVFSAVVSGEITDSEGVPVSYASVYVKNTTLGVAANVAGKYFIELPAGKYTLVYSYVGFKKVEKQIILNKNQHLILDVSITENISEFDEIDIVADKFDRGKYIMSQVRENRKKYIGSIQNYKCEIYTKTSIKKEFLDIESEEKSERKKSDTIKSIKRKKKNDNVNEYLKKERLNLIEYIAEVYYQNPNKYKENIIVFHDYSEKKKHYGKSVSIGGNFRDDDDIIPIPEQDENIYIYKTVDLVNSFNFYKNLLKLPKICTQPLISPIAASSPLSYKYEYIESFFENNKKIYKIRVIPRNKHDALFYGNIFVQDSTWSLTAVDLSINKQALLMHKNFSIIENFKNYDINIYLPEKINIIYTIKDGKKNILGEIRNKLSKYEINIQIDKKIFSNEIRTYADDAFDKDSLFWKKNRPVQLKTEELIFIEKSDSLAKYYTSKEYLDKQDSLFNKISWWLPLSGYGHKNHYKGTEWYIDGIPNQIVPFGVGGYRHRLPLYINKEFKNSILLETKEFIDYGFLNKDVKGKIGVGLTYYPKKFIRTFITVGNTYERINNYASLEQTFSRSNFVNSKSVEIKQRIEIINGLYAELSLIYANQNPITDLKLSSWSEFVFGELNRPSDFEKYIHSEIRLDVKYIIGQKYTIRKNKKIILGKNYPQIFAIYRKGLPDIFESNTNFDYLELGTKAELKLARFGSSRWEVAGGIFPNKKNLRVLEYKFFRGSDRFFFSDPLMSFQLLGLTLNSNSQFVKANYIHHFEGNILGKIPFMGYTKISLAGGAGILSIPKENFNHFEMFAGLERPFRIKKQIFRIGIYGVTADNSLSNPDITLKIGVSFFNSYSGKWTY